MKRKLLTTWCAILIAAPGASALTAGSSTAVSESIVMSAMKKELARSFSKLKNAGPAPMHYLAYRIYDHQSYSLSASYGGLDSDPEMHRMRQLCVELRVGSPQLDSTHHLRNEFGGASALDASTAPIDDDENAIRAALWNETDLAFKSAQRSFKEAQTNKEVLVAEEDQSNDFSIEKPHQYTGKVEQLNLDVKAWQDRLRRASALYNEHPKITDSKVTISASKIRRYIATSEGTRIEDDIVNYDVVTMASATADDGMRVWLYDHIEAPNAQGLPDEAKLKEMVQKIATAVEQLREARPAEPFAGPVILRSKASGVFFHEVFGHRAEGHRQKDEDEGRTFTKMVGKKIMPSFISVMDDPTCRQLNGRPLNGFYRFDDEGVPAQKVVLVDQGVLRKFLMGRSPVKGMNNSNGHGRCSSWGSDPVARQANLIVQSSKTVPYSKLRQMLIAEAKRQHKPYGLIFDEIAGGFTSTQSWMPQVFKLLPLRVYRVYTDGRADQLLRGVSIIGTPLASLEKIVCAADDCDTFNGNCGAESGWVPVSASSPSLLLQTLEIERQHKDQNKPPLLPPPPKGSD